MITLIKKVFLFVPNKLHLDFSHGIIFLCIFSKFVKKNKNSIVACLLHCSSLL